MNISSINENKLRRLNDLKQLEEAKKVDKSKIRFPLRLNRNTVIYVKKENLNDFYKRKMIKKLGL